MRARAANGARVERSADPYRDLDVIDSRAPRANQAVIGSMASLAFVIDWWPLLAILALQLAIGLRFGRRYCLPCIAYFEVIQPRFGEGAVEDSRPPRFANQVGLAVLGLAAVSHVVGLTTLGWALGLLVAALALLAAITGMCVGCEIYRLGARLRRVNGPALDRFDPADLGVQPSEAITVVFTHPLCTDCHAVEAGLRSRSVRFVGIDVRARPDLARKYGVAVVPTVVSVGPGGTASVIA